MWQELLIAHRQSKQAFPVLDNAVLWSTCLRQLVFFLPQDLASLESSFKPEDEILRGREAYQLCLEICAGLHSPILGETEVFGQFREFFLKLPGQNPFHKFLRSFAEQVITDTKQVRQEHLLNLGAQSYGSLLRRSAAGTKSLTIIGAGQLAEEILPWFYETTEISVVARRLEQATELAREFPKIKAFSLEQKLAPSETIFLAAPMPAEAFSAWLKTQDSPRLVVDLRGEAALDPIDRRDTDFKFLSLQDLFSSMERQRENQEARSAQAREQIAKLAAKTYSRLQSRAEHRPFGWDDVCA